MKYLKTILQGLLILCCFSILITGCDYVEVNIDQTYEGRPLAWPTCELIKDDFSVILIDKNYPPATIGGDTNGDIFKVMIILEDDNGNKGEIPIPLISSEFRDIILTECYGEKDK